MRGIDEKQNRVVASDAGQLARETAHPVAKLLPPTCHVLVMQIDAVRRDRAVKRNMVLDGNGGLLADFRGEGIVGQAPARLFR